MGSSLLIITDVTQANVPFPAEENPPEQQHDAQDQHQDELHTSEANDGQKVAVWINQSERQLSSEDSNDGDALTKELIKTVEQLEVRRAEEGMRATENPADGLMQSEKKRLAAIVYRCNLCHFMFTKRILLTWHHKMHQHMFPKAKGNFACNICGKHTLCQSTLQSHMKIHTGDSPHYCLVCGDAFNQKEHLTQHIKTHVGEEPFGCYSCPKFFKRYSTLKKHVSAKHSD